MSSKNKWYSPRPLIRDFKQAYKTDKKVLVYLTLTFVILLMLLINSFDTFSTEGGCKLADVPQSNPIQKTLYDRLMRLRFPEAKAKYVSMVTISEANEPLSVITNTCESRKFLTALVKELDKLHVLLIAVDQSFSGGACLDDPANQTVHVNRDFRQALEGAGVPIVVGWGTHKRPGTAEDDDCLMLNKPFAFHADSAETGSSTKENVFFGLIRLNNNNLKIPLRWSVFPYAQGRPVPGSGAVQQESFSLIAATIAAKVEHPSIVFPDETLMRDIENNEHPYSSFVREMKSWSAMDVLCYGKDTPAKDHPEWGDCTRIDHHSFDDLEGQVVVIGSEIPSDAKAFLGEQRYGAELHANYIEALLNGRYVKTVNPRLDKGVVVAFVALMLFFQFLAVRKLPDYKGLSDDTALWITCAIFVVLATICFAMLEWQGWFFPVFFLSCFPISVSLVILTVSQMQVILTKRHLKKLEGVTK